jgi:ornithine cyclodeaminase
VLLRGDVFVELAEQTRVEGEIQQMPADFPVTELWELFSGKKKGRTAATQITIFDSVGFALEDFAMLRYLQDKTEDMGFYTGLDILVKPEDPRDLFGLL